MTNNLQDPPINNSGNMNDTNSNEAKNVIYYVDFPDKYKRKLIDSIDLRFAIIWLITFIFQFSMAFYFSLHPPKSEYTIPEINKIQKQFAELILKSDLVKKNATTVKQHLKKSASDVPDTSPKDETTNYVEKKSISNGTGTVKFSEKLAEESDSYVPSKDRIVLYDGKNRSANNKLTDEVSSKGLLALLGSTSGNATGEEVQELLGEAAGRQKNLKQVLGNVNGLKKSGKSPTSSPGQANSRGAKGTRAQKNNEIEGLITDRKQVTSSDIKRQQGFLKEKVTTIKSDKNAVFGNRDSDEISIVINQHNAAIQSCYDRELKRNPDLKGKLVVRFTITTDGRVKNVNLISSTLNNSRVERCIVGKIRRWDDFGAIDAALGETTYRQIYAFGY